MAVINLKRREIQIKIVYYGPGRGGKTTNLEFIHRKNKSRLKSDLIKIDTRGDRTLFFDFMPFKIGRIRGFDVRVQLYTVPGQQRYESSRRLVLRGVDGVVFVADSMAVRRQANILSFDSLKRNLAVNNKRFEETPLVVQCNKVDVVDNGIERLPRETIEKDLEVPDGTPVFEASALFGREVVPTLKKSVILTMASLESLLKDIADPRGGGSRESAAGRGGRGAGPKVNIPDAWAIEKMNAGNLTSTIDHRVQLGS